MILGWIFAFFSCISSDPNKACVRIFCICYVALLIYRGAITTLSLLSSKSGKEIFRDPRLKQIMNLDTLLVQYGLLAIFLLLFVKGIGVPIPIAEYVIL